MSTVIAVGASLAAIALILGGAFFLGRKAGSDATLVGQHEADDKVQARMQEAREQAPTTKADLIKDLQNGGLL